MASFLKLVHCIDGNQDLNSRYSVEHVCIMARCSSKPSILLLAGKHKVNGFLPGQGIRVAQKVQGSQPPVNPIEPQMLRQPILQLIFPLLSPSTIRPTIQP